MSLPGLALGAGVNWQQCTCRAIMCDRHVTVVIQQLLLYRL
jgi:hypothetical protein